VAKYREILRANLKERGMTVEINADRVAYILSYDTNEVDGDTADLRATNPADLSDVSTRDGFMNDGNVYINVPAGYHGEINVVITGSDGGEDTGTIEV
jgi:hypothetical protein